VLRPVLAAALLAVFLAAPAGATAAAKPVRVTVLEYEFGFKLSRHTVPPGKVTFVMGNEGGIVHNFDIIGVAEGPFLVPGQSALMTVTLKKGTYTYVCSVKYHAAQGMQGTLYVR
jgi:plastocyanin